MAIYYFKNNTAGTLTINTTSVVAGAYFTIYDSVSDTANRSDIDWIANSMQTSSTGINKQLFNSELLFYIDAVAQTATIYYSWWDSFYDTYIAKVATSLVTAKVKTAFGITVDGAGSVLTTGNKGTVVAPYAFTITGYDIVSDVSGSVSIDIWKNTSPPSVSNSICAGSYVLLSSAQSNKVTSVPTWTVAVSEGDFISFYINSVTSIKRLTLTIKGTR